MGCFSSKPDTTAARCLNTDAGGVPPSPAPQAGSEDRGQAEQRSQTAAESTWLDKPDELKHTLLHTRVGDRALDELIAAVLDAAKRSFKIRVFFGEADIIAHLGRAMAEGPASTAKTSAQALKLLSFCQQNHLAFLRAVSSVPLLIDALTHEEYRVSICALSALCNLSATPACLSRFAANTELLAALERILMQKRVDSEPQAHAAQLLLNLTAQFSFKLVDNASELELLLHGNDAALTVSTSHGGVKPAPVLDMDPSTGSQDMVQSLKATSAPGMTPQATPDGRPVAVDPRTLLSTALNVLCTASALDTESRESCIEVVLALLQLPGSFLTPDPALVPCFVQQHGIAIIVAEATRDGALASSLMLVSDVLRLFARTHAAALFRGKLVQAVASMLSFRTLRGSDERHVDVDIQHAALMLVQMLDKQGDPAEQQQLAQEVIERLPDCLATSSVAAQLAACQVIKLYEGNPATRQALRGAHIVRRLVELANKRHPLTAAPAVQCIGIMCDLSSDNADAVIRAAGVASMLTTLQEDCPAQAQRQALVSISKVLQRAHAHSVSPELQTGRTISLAVSVLMHTAHSGVTSQAQWGAWCCRVLRDAASVDALCAAKVVSVLAKNADVLRLIGLEAGACTDETVMPALQRAARACSGEFLAVVSELQTLEEAVATALVRGRHPLLRGDPAAALPEPEDKTRGRERSDTYGSTTSVDCSAMRSAAAKSMVSTTATPTAALGTSVGMSMMAATGPTERTATGASNKAVPGSVQRFDGTLDLTDGTLVHSTTLNTTRERTASPPAPPAPPPPPMSWKAAPAMPPVMSCARDAPALSSPCCKGKGKGGPIGLSFADDALTDGRRQLAASRAKSPLLFPELPLGKDAPQGRGMGQPVAEGVLWRGPNFGGGMIL